MNQNEANENLEVEDQDVGPGKLIWLNEHYSYDPQLNTISLTSALEGLDHEKLNRQAQTFANQENAHG
jgi:hypothetical protein